MAHIWKLITSRHDNLHPYAQIISRLSVALIIYVLLNSYLTKSYIPAVVLAFMVASSFRTVALKSNAFANLLMPQIQQSDRQAVLNAVAGFDAYRDRSNALIKRRYALFAKMPFKHRKIATEAGYLDRLQALEQKVAANAKVVAGLARFAKKKYAVKAYELGSARPVSNISVIELLHHYVRDWSQELTDERTLLFEPLLSNLRKEFGQDVEATGNKKVLVPGSGLARAAYEISKLGFQTEAVEYSHLMDIAAHFVYNVKDNLATGPGSRFELFPYVHEFSHQEATASQLRGVYIPDVGDIKKPKNLTLGYGDFTEMAETHAGEYDAIVSLFLIDTAENVMNYLDSIQALLKPGGIWINYGPLKWGTAPQAEFNLEEMKRVIPKFGLVIEKEFQGFNEYNGDRQSLWQDAYKIRGWVARKA